MMKLSVASTSSLAHESGTALQPTNDWTFHNQELFRLDQPEDCGFSHVDRIDITSATVGQAATAGSTSTTLKTNPQPEESTGRQAGGKHGLSGNIWVNLPTCTIPQQMPSAVCATPLVKLSSEVDDSSTVREHRYARGSESNGQMRIEAIRNEHEELWKRGEEDRRNQRRQAAIRRKNAERQEHAERLAKLRDLELKRAQQGKERDQRTLERIARKQEQKRSREAQVTRQLLVQGSNLITFGPGLEIKHVVPGFELCKVTIRNLPLDAPQKEIEDIVRSQGIDKTLFRFISSKPDPKDARKTSQVAELLMRIEEAQAIGIGLEQHEVRGRFLGFEIGTNVASGSMEFRYNEAINASHRTLSILWSKFRDVDRDAPANDFGAFARAPPICSIHLDVDDVDSFSARLKSTLIELYGCIESSFRTTARDDDEMESVAEFSDREVLETVRETLQDAMSVNFPGTPSTRVPQLRFIMPNPLRPYQYSVDIPKGQYVAQKTQWDAIAKGGAGMDGECVRIEEREDGAVRVTLQGANQQDIGPLKVRVEGLAAGERLDHEHWHNTFLLMDVVEGLADRVKKSTGVYVSVDRRRRALKIFGRSKDISAAKADIRIEVERLNQIQWDIHIPRQSVRFFVATGLPILKEALGEDNVTLDTAPRGKSKIKLRGGDDAIQHARKLIEEAVAASKLGLTPHSVEGGEREGGAACLICHDTPIHTEVLGCGHPCCEPCLRYYLTSAASAHTFPLVCMGNEATCNTAISIPIIERYLTKLRFSHLVESVFSSHIQSNPRKFKCCTTPDCTQIYQCDTDQEFHQCPACFSRICSSCSEAAHGGMTCEEQRNHSNPEEQQRLTEEWAQANDVKRCPSCDILTEKREGCNHMTCSQCNGHWCWICRGIFTRDTIYHHMNTAHGTITGAAVVQLDLPRPAVGWQEGEAAHQRPVTAEVARNHWVIEWQLEVRRRHRMRLAEEQRERRELLAQQAAQEASRIRVLAWRNEGVLQQEWGPHIRYLAQAQGLSAAPRMHSQSEKQVARGGVEENPQNGPRNRILQDWVRNIRRRLDQRLHRV